MNSAVLGKSGIIDICLLCFWFFLEPGLTSQKGKCGADIFTERFPVFGDQMTHCAKLLPHFCRVGLGIQPELTPQAGSSYLRLWAYIRNLPQPEPGVQVNLGSQWGEATSSKPAGQGRAHATNLQMNSRVQAPESITCKTNLQTQRAESISLRKKS